MSEESFLHNPELANTMASLKFVYPPLTSLEIVLRLHAMEPTVELQCLLGKNWSCDRSPFTALLQEPQVCQLLHILVSSHL